MQQESKTNGAAQQAWKRKIKKKKSNIYEVEKGTNVLRRRCFASDHRILHG